MMTTTARTTTGLGMGALGIVLAGCATSPPPQAPPSTTIAPPPSSASSTNEQAAITRAYKEFWKVTHRLDQMPAQQWRSAVAEVATEPMSTWLLTNARSQRDKGVEVYGHVTARITKIHIDGDRATLTDCQDASQSGQADAKTGNHKTVGVARNPVTGTLTQDKDGRWRVSRISYPGGQC